MSTAPVRSTLGLRAHNQNQRRQRIVQTAAALALRGGVEAMQMRSVAERAGVALGTLYRYFPSKMDLVAAVVTEELDVLESSIVRRPPTSDTPAGRATDLLMRASRGLVREPELADALVRSLIFSEVTADLGTRLTGMLWRVAYPDVPQHPGPTDSTSAEYVALDALVSVWIFEVLEVLNGRRDLTESHDRLEVAASRLLRATP